MLVRIFMPVELSRRLRLEECQVETSNLGRDCETVIQVVLWQVFCHLARFSSSNVTLVLCHRVKKGLDILGVPMTRGVRTGDCNTPGSQVNVAYAEP